MGNKLEGEGSYEGTRRYRRGLEKHIRSGKTAEAAEKARRAVETHGEELKRAEEVAKKGPKATKSRGRSSG